MITSWLDREVVWLRVEGEFLADEMIAETDKWLNHHFDEYVGYIVDVRQMTTQTAAEKLKLESAAKKNQSGKVRAVLGKDQAFSVLIKIYIRLTSAEGIRYFTNEDEAHRWILSFKQK